MTTVTEQVLRDEMEVVLARVAAGETVRITSGGRPVADLVPVDRRVTFVEIGEIVAGIGGVLRPDDRLDDELRELDGRKGCPAA